MLGVALRIAKLIKVAADTAFIISGIIPNVSDNVSCFLKNNTKN
jgi:hypothetical protein